MTVVIAYKIWADARGTWVEADPDEQQRFTEIEYIHAAQHKSALLTIKQALDNAPDEFTCELWASDNETLGAYVDRKIAEYDAGAHISPPDRVHQGKERR